MKLIVFSICKDEAETIGKVLDRIPLDIDGIDEIEKWVISDGSIEDTVEVAKNHGAYVYEGVQQKRLALRFQQAVDIALGNGADIAVNIDGDLQFNPSDIPKLVEPILEGKSDFVAADRFTDPETGKVRKPENMPGGKYVANRLGSWAVGKLSGAKFPDVTCGFRAYSRKALIALNLNSKYTYTQESFQVLAAKRMTIKTVPVEVKYYPGRKSRVVTNFGQFLFGSALNILRAFRDFAPLKFFGMLGVLSFVIGLGFAGFSGLHWLQTGTISPYKAVGIVGIYFITVALFVWGLGLASDMMQRLNNNQEKILEYIKEERYKK